MQLYIIALFGHFNLRKSVYFKMLIYEYLKNKEKAVLNRLKKYKENYLNYLKDFEFPFDDNISERDLKATKLKKKSIRMS